MAKTIVFMGVPLHIAGRDEVLKDIESSSKPVRIATVNPEFILDARKSPTFQTALGRMTHCTVDGTGLSFALRILTVLFRADIPASTYHGSDLVEDLFHTYSQGEKSFYFLGGEPGVAERTTAHVQKRHPNLRIAGSDDGGRIDKDNVRLDPELKDRILAAKPDILLVAFGAPKQELWISEAFDLKVPVMIGVGGTFDFYVKKKRAPFLMRRLALEWLYRACTESGHAKRAFRAAVWFPLSFAWALATGSALQK